MVKVISLILLIYLLYLIYLFQYRVGWVESKLRVLIRKLEVTPLLKWAHPWPNNVDIPNPKWKFSTSFFMGLTFDVPSDGTGPRNVDLTPAVVEFTSYIREWSTRKELGVENMDVCVRYVRK